MTQKFFLSLALLMTLSFSAHATSRYPAQLGSECGLTDEYGADSWKEIKGSIDLSEMSDAQIRKLPTLTKQQLIIAVKIEFAEAIRDGKVTVRNTIEAVNLLREASEGDDLYVSEFAFGGSVFTQVKFYPGGNPGGVIFESDTLRAIATIGDSDVLCL